MEQSLEASLLKELSDVRDTAGKMCMAELHYNNSPLIMALLVPKVLLPISVRWFLA